MAGFAIPVVATAAAIAIFLAGSPRYKKRPPKGSVLATASRIVAEAAWATIRPGRGSSSSSSTPVSAAVPWLDRAKRSHGGSFAEGEVEGVKYVVRLLPFLLFLMPYWVRNGT